MDNLIVKENKIQDKIFTIRDCQVLLDKDLAELYKVETRTLKQSVRRNRNRFPNDFMYELTNDEIDSLVSQSVIPSRKHLGGAKPFVFTEQGVAILSSVLKSKIAIDVNIAIFRAFAKMRRYVSFNTLTFQKFNYIGKKLLTHDKNFEKIFKAIEAKDIKPKQGVFFDAYLFISDLIKKAKISIVLIDNYTDETVLSLFSKNQNIKVKIYSKNISKELKLDLKEYNLQYNPIEIIKFNLSHDRFLIIDKKQVYHLGASLKDLVKNGLDFQSLILMQLKF